MARLLFVHAHPDDETIASGVALAHHVAAGDEVRVLTCTLGEEGEVIPADLAHLEGAEGDPLGIWRREELRTAMRRLGVAHDLLGADEDAGVLSRYRDSGMVGMPSAHHPRAFAAADVAEAAGLVAAYLERVRPDVVVTYDEHGGYGHPDHIQTRRVTLAALERLPAPARPAHVFEILTPRSWAQEDRAWLREHVSDPALTIPGEDDPFAPSVVPDELVTHVVVDPSVVRRQAHALQAHATQVKVGDGYFALSNHIAARLGGREGFRRLEPGTDVASRSGGAGPDGRPGTAGPGWHPANGLLA